MQTYKSITKKELKKKKIIPEKKAFEKIQEPFLYIKSPRKNQKTPPLVKIEIAYRKCKKNGLFNN
jgi:hypothetical protein